MNFDFDLNQIVPYTITQYDYQLRIVTPKNLPREEWQPQLDWGMKQKLAYIIDRMGEASRKAQGLREVITSSQRFQLSEQHRIYFMKDPNSNNGKGSIVGMLKVGQKHLFIYDHMGKNHEMKPLCVLDFYINEVIQRRGYGKKLFDHMLQNEEVSPAHCAIDKPSEKSVRFLKKHYALKNAISQVNNFVVFEGFFKNRQNQDVYVRNRRMTRDTLDSFRKCSADPSFNRSDKPPIGLEYKTMLNRTGSVDLRYNNREKINSYVPDFTKESGKANTLKHLNSGQFAVQDKLNYRDYNGNQSLFNDNSSQNSFLNYESNLKLNNFENLNTPQNGLRKFGNGITEDSSILNNSHRSSHISNFSPAPVEQMSRNNPLNNTYFNQPFYQPFPSLNNTANTPNNNDRLASKPPIPGQFYNSTKSPSLAAANPHSFQNDRNYTDLTHLSRNTLNNNSRFEPFPSLNAIKSAPEFYGVTGSHYRKTRLW